MSLLSETRNTTVTVYLKTVVGQILAVDLLVEQLGAMTIADIKQRVEEVQCFPASFQRFIFGGGEVLDHQVASDLGIQDGTILQLVLRLNTTYNTESDTTHNTVHTISIDLSSLPPSINVNNMLIKEKMIVDFKVIILIDVITLLLWIDIIPEYLTSLIVGSAIAAAVLCLSNHALFRTVYGSLCYMFILASCVGVRILTIATLSQPIVIAILAIGALVDICLLDVIRRATTTNVEQSVLRDDDGN